MSKTICELYGLNKVINQSVKDLSQTQLFGIELEIEGVTKNTEDLVDGLPMNVTTDGSLRNNGFEFITQPVNLPTLQWALDLFFGRAKFSEKNYSERTSVHVHVNCQDLTKDQLYSILLLYQLYERLLYAWVGNERDKNIFCVPWNQTALPNLVLRSKALDKLRNWQKYTGLNLLPLLTQGTIEFRHMAGTNDIKKIITWCQIIEKMFLYGRRNPMEKIKETIVTLNTTSHYAGFTMEVFEGLAEYFVALPKYMEMLEEGVLDTKYGILVPKNDVVGAGEDFFNEEPPAPRDGIEDILAMVQRQREEMNRVDERRRQERDAARRVHDVFAPNPGERFQDPIGFQPAQHAQIDVEAVVPPAFDIRQDIRWRPAQRANQFARPVNRNRR